MLLAAMPGALTAQSISGRVTDGQNGAPVGLAAVFVLDAARQPVLMAAADVEGRYRLELPAPGEYYLVSERLGYFETESPLLAVGGGAYVVDLEMRPEPIRLDPLDVTVSNERLEDYLTLEFGQHPASLPGYRSVQGTRLEEARLKARDTTDFLRWLYIPVSHGSRVCVGGLGTPPPPRTWADRTRGAPGPPDPTGARASSQQCGALFLNGLRCRNEHLGEIDLRRVAVLVTVRGAVHLYTRDFDWTLRPGEAAGTC